MYKCKNCVFCTWACPNWMCMNKEHPDFDLEDDCPITVNLEDDGCIHNYTYGLFYYVYHHLL